MRLTLSLLFAAALHGIVLGVADVSAQRGMPRPTLVASIPVEIEVVAHPDPVREAAPLAVKAALTKAPSPILTSSAPKEEKPRASPVHESAPSEESPTESPIAVPQVTASVPTGAAVSPPAATSAVPARASGSALPARAGNFMSAAPRYRANPPPEYPIPSRRRSEEGVVLLNVVVQSDGLPASVSLNHSSGYPLLDRAALDAVRRWSFEPARAAGVAVSSSVVVPVRFSLSN